jgi:hypothetical protein
MPRDITYDFEELPIYAGTGASRRVVARVAGVADFGFSGDDLIDFCLLLTDEAGKTEIVDPKDPLHEPIKRELMWRWNNYFFDADRPYHDENDEHRLTVSMVL